MGCSSSFSCQRGFNPRKGSETRHCETDLRKRWPKCQRGFNPRKGSETLHKAVVESEISFVREALIPVRGRKLFGLDSLNASAILVREALIPVRGRKLVPLIELGDIIINRQRGFNPRKGSETQRRAELAPCPRQGQRGFNPRKGSETSQLRLHFHLSPPRVREALIPVRGRKLAILCLLL